MLSRSVFTSVTAGPETYRTESQILLLVKIRFRSLPCPLCSTVEEPFNMSYCCEDKMVVNHTYSCEAKLVPNQFEARTSQDR
ncbi:hypothetical protein RRG08_047286 [Elysia crispata]|uniref:Uncharacterized protein n=1 Tax=Elysia crispata TaxID=231223 RepID=A0AAE0ZC82_9GAST|nr:hypothetical protein RRG08_047286 [Elysia crispata]